ncbi:17069_t:CDS:2 [Funneliformis geosporum]|uniref:17069_t:CDS:1 n=1 Tax=Funneliformis geosporum TaxID=1117311 RepID=A0A9W4SW92_9GLOM|nr:17069_t:CDS:2 [Funneliformis geosporum]
MNTPNSTTSSELETPLSFSFTNINSLVHNLISKPTFSPFNLEQDIDQVLQSLKRQCEEEYVKLNEIRSKLKHFETPLNALSEEEKRDTLNESEIIHDTLLDKLKRFQQNIGSMTQKSEIGVIREKINTVRKDFDTLMYEFRKFADTNFPPQDCASDEIMIDNSDDLENENEIMLSLKDMIEDLMNQTYSNPNNPYLKFDPDRVWNPYVETLIRAGIAKRHPNDANMLKLVEFHL